MPSKPRTSTKTPVKVPAASPTSEPCQTCKGDGFTDNTVRKTKVKGQTVICLTCLGDGAAS